MWLTILLNALPSLIQLAEQLHPAPKSGPDKLNTVLSTGLALVRRVPELEAQAEKLKAMLTPIVNSAVALYNAFGHGANVSEVIAKALETANSAVAALPEVKKAVADVHQVADQVRAEGEGQISTEAGAAPQLGVDPSHEGHDTQGGTFSGERGG